MNNTFMKDNAGISFTGIYGYANGPVYACEFIVQYCGQLLCGKDQ